MTKVLWVFGGTAIGKKHFIREAVACPTQLRVGLTELIPTWIEDGLRSAPEFQEILDGFGRVPERYNMSRTGFMIRWQWGREQVLRELVADFPPAIHLLYLVKADVHVQVSRVIAREGSLKWDEKMLRREAEDIDDLVQDLSARHSLPVYHVNANPPGQGK